MYYAVFYERRLRISSDQLTWQDACIECFQGIGTMMKVKALSAKQWDIMKKSSLKRLIESIDGWFYPMILGDKDFTIERNQAFNEDDLKLKLTGWSERVVSSLTVEDLDTVHAEFAKYIRFIHPSIVIQFIRLYETVKGGLKSDMCSV